MEFSTGLLSSLQAAVSFVLGTLVAPILRRLTFEGLAIGRLPVRRIDEDSSNPRRTSFIFTTAVKLANVRKESILLEDVRALPITVRRFFLAPGIFEGRKVSLERVRLLRFANTKRKLGWVSDWSAFVDHVACNRNASRSPSGDSSEIGSDSAEVMPPIIIKPDEERVVSLTLRYSRHEFRGSGFERLHDFERAILHDKLYYEPLSIRFKINGRYRRYRLSL